MFEICGMHFCSVFCETLWMRLIATFQFSWLPFFDPADATLCLAWVPSYSFGLSATLPWPGCQFIHSAWVPHYLGVGANLFIRPGCRCIYPAWVPHYWFGLGANLFTKFGKSAIHSRQVCHFIQGWASLPICNLSGLGATFIPHGWCATFIHLTADAPHLLNSPDRHSLRGTFVKPSVKNWTFVENPSVKLHRLELAFEKLAKNSFWKEKIQQHSEPPFWRRNLLLSNDP